jgi:hypothetical protein
MLLRHAPSVEHPPTTSIPKSRKSATGIGRMLWSTLTTARAQRLPERQAVFVILVAFIVLAATIYWSAERIVAELKGVREESSRARGVTMIQVFGPAMSEAARDPRALLVWYPLAKAARAMDPDAFASLDRAAQRLFPFSPEQVQAAHAQWTADWLAWERTHDAEYKLKAAAIEQELGSQPVSSGASPVLRARLDAVERDKLDSYQRRYQEYVEVAKALQALTASSS